MKNKILALSMVLALCASVLCSCTAKTNGPAENAAKDSSNTDKYSVVSTIFPPFDWTKQIIGNQAEQYELTLLLDNGVDLHSYQPTAEDIAKISDCDLFIYVGGESDGWVEDALQEATNQNMRVINLMETLGETVKEEEVVEGMQAEDEHESEEEAVIVDSEESEQEEEPEYDEHVWLSLKNAIVIVDKIEQELEALDSTNASVYQENAESYIESLQELDAKYQTTVDSAVRKTVLFGDRFPFRYMVDDYGMDYYAAFVGCSAETEASFETITFLSGKVDELDIPSVLVIEKANQKLAKAIINNTADKNQTILVMNSLQSVTGEDVKKGFTYLDAMKDNLSVLEQALKN